MFRVVKWISESEKEREEREVNKKDNLCNHLLRQFQVRIDESILQAKVIRF